MLKTLRLSLIELLTTVKLMRNKRLISSHLTLPTQITMGKRRKSKRISVRTQTMKMKLRDLRLQRKEMPNLK